MILFNDDYHLFAYSYGFTYSYPMLIIFKYIYLTHGWDNKKEYVLSQPHRHWQDVTKGQFLSGVQLIWIYSFTFLSLVALQKQKNPIFPNIYP